MEKLEKIKCEGRNLIPITWKKSSDKSVFSQITQSFFFFFKAIHLHCLIGTFSALGYELLFGSYSANNKLLKYLDPSAHQLP